MASMNFSSSTLMSTLLLLSVVTFAAAVTVRETETPLLSIHRPIDPDRMQSMLGDKLVPDVYDGQAYIQVSVFDITHLETQIPIIGFVGTGTTSWCLRVSAYVKNKVTGEKGYVILSADFDHSIGGHIMTTGCKHSQLGTDCGTVKVQHQSSDHSEHYITVDNDARPLLRLGVTLREITQKDFYP
eukprot:GFYU01061024.1.p1 GENE.GFYU01061024.1~~GFYU01061024.1.p1  ORF type:complete len:185 (+),score=55.11 GFYU01061024.1:268-822(+)